MADISWTQKSRSSFTMNIVDVLFSVNSMGTTNAEIDQDSLEKSVMFNMCKVALRFAIWPVLVLVELILLPTRLAWDEKDEYMLPIPRTMRNIFNRVLDVVEADFDEDVKIVWSRIINAYHVSLGFLIQITLFNVVLGVCQKLGVVYMFRGLSSRLEFLVSLLFPGLHKTTTGNLVSCVYSIVNASSPTFDIPCDLYRVDVARFPVLMDRQNGSPIDHPYNSHFMSQWSRLAYEHPIIIQDVVETQWHLKLDGYAVSRGASGVDSFSPADSVNNYFCTASLKARPTCAAYVCSNDTSLMVAFCGSHALDLINWRSDATLAMINFSDIGGVHAGFYNSLFEPRESNLFDQVVSIVSSPENQSKGIFVTGHGSGGAMSCIFAQVASRFPDLQRRIKGIFTFGQPRTGNRAFRLHFERLYADLCMRFVHGNDLIPKVPAGLGYKHHLSERFITSFRNVIDDPEEIQDAREHEDRHSFLLGFIKLIASPIRKDSMLRFLMRIVLLPFPGISDHMPDCYEKALLQHAISFQPEGRLLK